MSGHIGYTSNLTAREIAETYGCSERTARRHKARGTVPDKLRITGEDGKTYPGSYRGPGERETDGTCHGDDLVMARNAIRRVKPGERFTEHDLFILETIAGESARLLRQWKEVKHDG